MTTEFSEMGASKYLYVDTVGKGGRAARGRGGLDQSVPSNPMVPALRGSKSTHITHTMRRPRHRQLWLRGAGKEQRDRRARRHQEDGGWPRWMNVNLVCHGGDARRVSPAARPQGQPAVAGLVAKRASRGARIPRAPRRAEAAGPRLNRLLPCPSRVPQEREYLQGRYVESEILNHSLLRHPHVRGASAARPALSARVVALDG